MRFGRCTVASLRIAAGDVGVGLTVLALVTVAALPAAANDRPLALRNTSPIANLYGLPRMLGATRLQGPGIEHQITLEEANNFTDRSKANQRIFFDGETSIISYRGRTAIGERWEVGVELPYVIHHGGGLDGPIDEFHELFGLPDGNRSIARRNRLDYAILVDGVEYANFQDSQRHVGDVRFNAGRVVLETQSVNATLRAQVKVPTGDADRLTGSGAWDVASWVEAGVRDVAGVSGFGLSLGGGAMYLGEGDIVPDDQERFVLVGHVGLNYRLSDTVYVHGQLDAHSKLWDNDVRQAESALQGTLGGRVKLAPRMWLDIAVLEDLTADSSSDVVFQFALSAIL